jgi:hypothetical protein
VLGRDGLEIAAEAAVADERLVALGELGTNIPLALRIVPIVKRYNLLRTII